MHPNRFLSNSLFPALLGTTYYRIGLGRISWIGAAIRAGRVRLNYSRGLAGRLSALASNFPTTVCRRSCPCLPSLSARQFRLGALETHHQVGVWMRNFPS